MSKWSRKSWIFASKRYAAKRLIAADDRVTADDARDVAADLDALAKELDLDHGAQHSTLDAAMSMHAGRPQLSSLDESLRCRILQPSLAGWSDTIDDTVRRSATGGGLGPVPYLAFSADPFIQQIGGRPIFRPRVDTLMVHLGHPLMGKAINWLSRRRFPGPQAVSRWTVRYGDIPRGARCRPCPARRRTRRQRTEGDVSPLDPNRSIFYCRWGTRQCRRPSAGISTAGDLALPGS